MRCLRSSEGIAIFERSMNSAVMHVFAIHVARSNCSSGPRANWAPLKRAHKRGLALVSKLLSHSLLHFLQTTRTFRVVTRPCLCRRAVTGVSRRSPIQFVMPCVCVSCADLGKSWHSQSGKTCSLLTEAPEAPPQKMHIVRPRRNGASLGILYFPYCPFPLSQTVPRPPAGRRGSGRSSGRLCHTGSEQGSQFTTSGSKLMDVLDAPLVQARIRRLRTPSHPRSHPRSRLR